MNTEPAPPPEGRVVTNTVWFGQFVSDSVERDFMATLGARHGVAVLTWPRDRERAAHLAGVGIPRLVLVPADESPPAQESLQDWVPAGASDDELHACLVSLAQAAEVKRARAGKPTFDDDGILHLGDASVRVPANEAAVVEILVDNFEQPVSFALLGAPGPDATVTPPHLRVRRLRQQLNTLGLEIVTTPDEAFILRACASHACVADIRPKPPRRLGHRRTLPMHFRSGLLAPDLP